MTAAFNGLSTTWQVSALLVSVAVVACVVAAVVAWWPEKKDRCASR